MTTSQIIRLLNRLYSSSAPEPRPTPSSMRIPLKMKAMPFIVIGGTPEEEIKRRADRILADPEDETLA